MSNSSDDFSISYKNLNQKINYVCLLGLCVPYLLFFIVLSFTPTILFQPLFHGSSISLGMFAGFSLILLSISLTALRCYSQ